MFYKALRGETEVWIHSRVYEFIVTNSIFQPDNLKTAYACPNCTDYCDTEKAITEKTNKN